MLKIVIAFVGIVYLILLFGLGSLFGYTILKPLIKAAHGRKATMQLYTSDFFSLTMVLVLPMMLITAFRNSNVPTMVAIVICVTVYVITIWIWARGAIKLSSIDVHSSHKRFVFLGILLPLTILGMVIGIPILLTGIGMSFSRPNGPLFAFMFLTGLVAAIPVAFVGKMICQWVVGDAEPEDKDKD